MDYTKILKRAWHILWHYPALWVFGFLLALTTASGSNGSPSGNSFFRWSQNNSSNGNGFRPNGPGNGNWQQMIERINNFMDMHFGSINEGMILTWAIAAGAVILLLVVLFTVLKYISLTAHIRMVDHLEETGEKLSWRKGFKLGWSPAAFKLWLIDLLVSIPLILLFLILFGCAAIPLLLGLTGGRGATAAGVIATIGIALMAVLIVVVVVFVINLWLRFAYRKCVLEGLGVTQSLGAGWKTLRSNLKDILLMWLILVGVRIAYSIALIPIVLVIVGIAIAFVGGLGLAVYAISTQLTVGLIVVAVLLLLLVLTIPITFVRGLGESYFESVWTLVYRETKPLLPAVISQVEAES